MLKEARDSMAGRVCILKMCSLFQREKLGLCDVGVFEPDYGRLSARQTLLSQQQKNG